LTGAAGTGMQPGIRFSSASHMRKVNVKGIKWKTRRGRVVFWLIPRTATNRIATVNVINGFASLNTR
ncbi:MAG: hypothetical protein WBA17_15530, partial [Saprospiraceae bacterium]